MQSNDFFIEKQKAVERMKEMQSKYKMQNGGMPPTPYFVSTNNQRKRNANSREKSPQTQNSPIKNSGVNLQFLDGLDSDVLLILGLFLLLSSEDSDQLLLYALLYILL